MVNTARLIRSIPLGDWSGWLARLGDLNGDGLPEILFAQVPYPHQEISCLTAIDLSGRVLWQIGQPRMENYCVSYDLAVQIHDQDGDGCNEVVAVLGDDLVILDGASGRCKRAAPVPGRDALIFCNLRGQGPRDIVVKDRYDTVWALDADLRPLWQHTGNVGHYPLPYDVFGEGRDCLMCGYQLLSPDGSVLWEIEARDHADALDVAPDLTGNDDGPSIVIGNGGIRVVDARSGRLRWRYEVREAQHVNIGRFRPDLPGLQICSVERVPPRTRAGHAQLRLHDATGALLWEQDLGRGSWLAVSHRCAWLGPEHGDQILLNRLGLAGPPRLVDGHGHTLDELPMPHLYGESGERPALFSDVPPPAGSPYGADFFPWPGQYGEGDPYADQNFAIGCDCYGDGREEVFVYDRKQLYVYTNTRARPDPRLYNHTIYVGRS